MKTIILVAAASLLLLTGAMAEDKIKIQPGETPTASITKLVPTMKPDCPAKTADATALVPGKDATATVGDAVPNMKPTDEAGCPATTIE